MKRLPQACRSSHRASGRFRKPFGMEKTACCSIRATPPGLLGALLRLIRDPQLLASLRHGIGDVHTGADQESELGKLYQDALASRRRPTRRIAAVVLNYRTPDDTRLAVKSLLASRRPLDQLIVVDNDDRQTARDALRMCCRERSSCHTGRDLRYSAA